ncbi:DUF5696 domain-containing protein [Paenibacillus tarimensis]
MMKRLMMKWFTVKRILIGMVLLLIVAAGIIFGETRTKLVTEEVEPEKADYTFEMPVTPILPEQEFIKAAESDALVLEVHPATGHFHVIDKRSNQLYRSYPDPDDWEHETASKTWKNHINSPVYMTAVEFERKRSTAPATSLLHDKGRIIDFKVLDDGFALTFDFVDKGIEIPVKVTLADDYIETRVIDEGIKEKGEHSIAELRVYPSFNAHHSRGQEGYLMIPDGSGALIRFEPNRSGTVSAYQARVYGNDYTFNSQSNFVLRQNAVMPVYGMKNESTAHLSVITEGDEYADIFAAPSGSYSDYNWITASFVYRQRFFQPTSSNGEEGFETYQRERFHTDRVIRTYILEPDEADYAGMARKYRQYLMDEYDLKKRAAAKGDPIPLHLTFYGGDLSEGFLGTNSYIPLTTTEQAKEIVTSLNQLGINKMNITYEGWQRGGQSKYGGNLPVDSRLGGNRGMEEFAAYANSLGFPVHLHVGLYGANNTEKDGFKRRRDGLRDLSSTIIDEYDDVDDSRVTFVSPRFIEKSFDNDLDFYERLGTNGLVYAQALGTYLNSDFNERYLATRSEVRQIQESIAEKGKKRIGSAYANRPNMYMLPYIDHINKISTEYSFDANVNESIPFLQIAIHGLVSYSAEFVNERDDYVKEHLRSIEYGAQPSFAVTYAPSDEILRTYGLKFSFSPHYKDWTTEMIEQYQLYNENFGHVQGQFIIGHQTLADGVRETTYEDGTRVIVNYNRTPYRAGNVEVGPEDFTVIRGGGSQDVS